jgi:hypothetical protein
VLTDPSLPVTDIEAKIDALGFGYGRTFGLAAARRISRWPCRTSRSTLRATSVSSART